MDGCRSLEEGNAPLGEEVDSALRDSPARLLDEKFNRIGQLKQVPDQWDWIAVLNRGFIQTTVVYAQTEGTGQD